MAAERTRPNILFFFTDDQRFDTIAALGNPDIITPNLDSLVARGTAFTNAHIMGGTSGAVCMPSRAMLHTGRTLFHIDGEGQDINAGHLMLGERLQRAGYETFGTGKWHNGPSAFARSFTCGDHIFFGGMSDHFNVPLNHFDPTGEYPAERIYRDTKSHSSDLFCEAAAEFLRNRGDTGKPFFAYVSFTAPHDPRDTHPKYHAMYEAAKIPTPENFMPEHPFDNGELLIRDEKLAPFPRTPEIIRKHIADYYAMITHADAQIGRVLDVLEQTGQASNTIIVFAGDNGLALGRHGLMGKQNIYDHSVRVPLIIAGAGVPAGQRRDAFCYLIDIYPTLCDLAGLSIPETVEGMSLVPVMADARRKLRRTLLLAYTHIHRGVREERWKLIEHVVDGERTTQLFDLRADPFEMNNLAGEAACIEHRQRLGKELLRWRDELDDRGESFWEAYLPAK